MSVESSYAHLSVKVHMWLKKIGRRRRLPHTRRAAARMRHQRPCRCPLRPERAALRWPCAGRRPCARQLDGLVDGRRPPHHLTPSTGTPMFAQAQCQKGLRHEPGGHGHRLQRIERRTQVSAAACTECAFQSGPFPLGTITGWPQRSCVMAETFCLASASASRILLPTAESWCCRESHAARCAPWLSWSLRPT